MTDQQQEPTEETGKTSIYEKRTVPNKGSSKCEQRKKPGKTSSKSEQRKGSNKAFPSCKRRNDRKKTSKCEKGKEPSRLLAKWKRRQQSNKISSKSPKCNNSENTVKEQCQSKEAENSAVVHSRRTKRSSPKCGICYTIDSQQCNHRKTSKGENTESDLCASRNLRKRGIVNAKCPRRGRVAWPKCGLCGRSFRTTTKKGSHEASHDQMKYCCPCGYCFETFYLLYTHSAFKHKKSLNDGYEKRCRIQNDPAHDDVCAKTPEGSVSLKGSLGPVKQLISHNGTETMEHPMNVSDTVSITHGTVYNCYTLLEDGSMPMNSQNRTADVSVTGTDNCRSENDRTGLCDDLKKIMESHVSINEIVKMLAGPVSVSDLVNILKGPVFGNCSMKIGNGKVPGTCSVRIEGNPVSSHDAVNTTGCTRLDRTEQAPLPDDASEGTESSLLSTCDTFIIDEGDPQSDHDSDKIEKCTMSHKRKRPRRKIENCLEFPKRKRSKRNYLKCPLCDRLFASIASRNIHIKNHDQMRYMCLEKKCRSLFGEFVKLHIHYRKGQKSQLPDNRERQCRIKQAPVSIRSGVNTGSELKKRLSFSGSHIVQKEKHQLPGNSNVQKESSSLSSNSNKGREQLSLPSSSNVCTGTSPFPGNCSIRIAASDVSDNAAVRSEESSVSCNCEKRIQDGRLSGNHESCAASTMTVTKGRCLTGRLHRYKFLIEQRTNVAHVYSPVVNDDTEEIQRPLSRPVVELDLHNVLEQDTMSSNVIQAEETRTVRNIDNDDEVTEMETAENFEIDDTTVSNILHTLSTDNTSNSDAREIIDLTTENTSEVETKPRIMLESSSSTQSDCRYYNIR